MIESDTEIANATDDELAAELNSTSAVNNRNYYEFSAEIARRGEERERQRVAADLAKPFNPRADISADAKYLWRNIFIWFWVVPLVLGIIAFIISHS